jgi:fatty acid desaturase
MIALSRGSILLVPALLVHGIVLVFLFAPLHESLHRTAFRSHRLNNSVASIAGLFLLLPPNWFRAFHFAHHRFTQIEGRDPELEAKRVETWPDYLIHLSGWRYWRSAVALLFRNALGRASASFVPKSLEPRLVREARIMLGVYALIAAISVVFRSDAALSYWILPALLGQPFLRAYLLAEHTGLPLAEDFWENTRPRSPARRYGSSPGICRFTPSTTSIPRCPFMRCQLSTRVSVPSSRLFPRAT